MKMVSLWIVVLAMLLSFATMFACGDDDDDDDTVAVDDDDDGDDDDDDDTTDDDDDDTTGPTWDGSQVIFVDTTEGIVSVNLDGLPAFEWTDPDDGFTKQAMYLSTVWDEAVSGLANPVETDGYRFNFEAADGYNPLVEKFFGDWSGLPTYAQLSQGWVIQYEDEILGTDLVIIWDEALGFPGFMSVKSMNGGSLIQTEELTFPDAASITVEYASLPVKGSVNLQGLPAFYDGDNDPCVSLAKIVEEAALSSFDPNTYNYAFNFINADDFNLLSDYLSDDTSGLPDWADKDTGKDIAHGWIKNTDADGFQIFWDAVTGYATDYSVDNMDGGTIEVYDVTPTTK